MKSVTDEPRIRQAVENLAACCEIKVSEVFLLGMVKILSPV